MKAKKNLFLLLVLIISLASCNDNEMINNQEQVSNSKNNPRFKSAGDQVFDLLGYGADITGEYLAPESNRMQVIDLTRLKNEQPGAVDDGLYDISNTKIEYGEDASILTNKLTVKVSGNASKGIYSGTVSHDYISSNTVSSTYSYALIEDRIFKKRLRLFGLYELLAQYTTQSFKDNLLKMTPDDIIRGYGTHVFTDIYLGAKFQLMYRSEILGTSKAETLTSGASVTAKNIFGISANVETYTNLVENNKKVFVNYKTIGGDASIGVTGNFNIANPQSLETQLTAWRATINGRLSMIDVQSGSMIPIYEFVSDPTKKAELKNAVNNYIESHALYQANPLYRYYNGKKHFYTTAYSELGAGKNGWILEKTQGYVLPTNSTIPNTVNLKRYYYAKKDDHFYTVGTSANSNWKYEWVECKVYKSQSSGTVPLYRYYNPNSFHHFYTTDYRELGPGTGGFLYEGIECYIFPNLDLK